MEHVGSRKIRRRPHQGTPGPSLILPNVACQDEGLEEKPDWAARPLPLPLPGGTASTGSLTGEGLTHLRENSHPHDEAERSRTHRHMAGTRTARLLCSALLGIHALFPSVS
ncbi:uncharacterized protein [Symphalangus syndactylus]|uniref:uncharacterized protein isoform X2 n=1 Tax=Symphalangus syndactylus TaxID=9590 RepID=UPI003006115B